MVAKLGKNEPVSMETLEKICKVFECNIGDIMEFVYKDNISNENGGKNE